MKNLIVLIFLLFLSVNIVPKDLDKSLMVNYRQLQILTKCKYVVSSGYRDIEHNKRVGGATRSLHLKAKALDLVISRLCRTSRKKIIRIAKKLFNKVIVYNTHIHVDMR